MRGKDGHDSDKMRNGIVVPIDQPVSDYILYLVCGVLFGAPASSLQPPVVLC